MKILTALRILYELAEANALSWNDALTNDLDGIYHDQQEALGLASEILNTLEGFEDE